VRIGEEIKMPLNIYVKKLQEQLLSLKNTEFLLAELKREKFTKDHLEE
jgi:hypothetical protein